MLETEMIEVYIKTDGTGKTICICERNHKRCKEQCDEDIVERDRFRGWREVMERDKFGR